MTHQSDPSPKVCTLPGLVIDSAWLADRLDAPDLRLIDMRGNEPYGEGHIPGAVQLDLGAITTSVDGVEGFVTAPDAYAKVMGQLGVDEGHAVVLYDSNWGLPAARVAWTLIFYGHPNVAILNGGWDRWCEEERPTTTTWPSPTPTRFVPRPAPSHLAELNWLQDHLDDPDLVIIDTRANGEYIAGHLPGAIKWDWMNGVPMGSWDAVRPVDELAAELSALGVTPDKEIVTYCRSGVRAAHTYLLLRHLGYPRVRNYDGSWLEWEARVLGKTHE